MRPTVTYRDRLQLRVGDLDLELHHSRGETDDHTWTWVPSHRAACIGDLMVWVFPNAGNPQKVQRYPLDWARALREIAAYEPELLLPAHGLPIGGRDRIHAVLDDVATALEVLVHQTLDLMNDGAPLDEIVHIGAGPRPPAGQALSGRHLRRARVRGPQRVAHVRRLVRRQPGPAQAAVRRRGGQPSWPRWPVAPTCWCAGPVELADAGDFRLACHLVELAVAAAPDDRSVHAARADVYGRRRHAEVSLMAKGIYGWAARQSQARL